MCICLCVCLCICICQAISAQVESFGVNPQYGLQDGVCCPGCSRCLGRLASTARHCLAPPEATDEGHSSTFGVVALSGRLRRRPPHGIGEPSRGSTSWRPPRQSCGSPSPWALLPAANGSRGSQDTLANRWIFSLTWNWTASSSRSRRCPCWTGKRNRTTGRTSGTLASGWIQSVHSAEDGYVCRSWSSCVACSGCKPSTEATATTPTTFRNRDLKLSVDTNLIVVAQMLGMLAPQESMTSNVVKCSSSFATNTKATTTSLQWPPVSVSRPSAPASLPLLLISQTRSLLGRLFFNDHMAITIRWIWGHCVPLHGVIIVEFLPADLIICPRVRASQRIGHSIRCFEHWLGSCFFRC